MSPASGTAAALLPAETSGRACARALGLQRELLVWSHAFPGLFDETRIPALGMAAAFITPWLDVDRLAPGARVATWCAGLDDMVDSGRHPDAFIEDTLAACSAVLGGDAPPGGQSLAGCLAAIRDELAAGAAFPVLADSWRTSVERVLVGTRYEWAAARSAASGGALPDLESYLEHATGSIAVSPYLLTVWLAEERIDLPARLEELSPALGEAEYAVRLRNDLTTFQRELKAGDMNALLLDTSPRDLTDRMRKHASRCRDLLAPLLDAGFPPAVSIDRLLGFTLSFYPIADFRR